MQIEALNLPVKFFTVSDFVEHYGAASWQLYPNRAEKFMDRWKSLFNNPELVKGKLT